MSKTQPCEASKEALEYRVMTVLGKKTLMKYFTIILL